MKRQIKRRLITSPSVAPTMPLSPSVTSSPSVAPTQPLSPSVSSSPSVSLRQIAELKKLREAIEKLR